jgi:hypothetical protein
VREVRAIRLFIVLADIKTIQPLSCQTSAPTGTEDGIAQFGQELDRISSGIWVSSFPWHERIYLKLHALGVIEKRPGFTPGELEEPVN